MADKEPKKTAKKGRAKEYDKKLVVTGSFFDVITAAVKDAESKSAKPKKD